MLNGNTVAEGLLRTLNDHQDTRRKIESRLADIEAEARTLRSQLSALDMLIAQTRATLIEQTSALLNHTIQPQPTYAPTYAAPQPTAPPPPTAPSYAAPQPAAPPPVVRPTAVAGHSDVQQATIELEDLEAIDAGRNPHALPTDSGNIRFNDFRIPQAATIVLREAGGPLHVSDIYQRMAEGGFEFRGQHQLITLAVSLSRAKRFRKVAPGTFELDPRYATGQVA